MEVKMDITTSDFYLFTLLLFYLSRLLAHLLLLATCSFILPPFGRAGVGAYLKDMNHRDVR